MSEQAISAFNQVDQQVANGMPATVLVERTNGDITTGQVMDISQNQTVAYFGDLSEGPKKWTPYKPVSNEKLTDKYQEHLAEKLAGKALQGSGVELDVDTVPREFVMSEVAAGKEPELAEESPVDKYTEAYVKEHPYAHLFDTELSDKQADEVAKRIEGMDFRSDDEKHLAAERAAKSALIKQRTAADHRYNSALQAGAAPEVAAASAERGHAMTYDELLSAELKKLGL